MWQGARRRFFPYGTFMGTLWDAYGTFTRFFAPYFSTIKRTILRCHAIRSFCRMVHGEGITDGPSTCSPRENTRRHEKTGRPIHQDAARPAEPEKEPKSPGESMAQGWIPRPFCDCRPPRDSPRTQRSRTSPWPGRLYTGFIIVTSMQVFIRFLHVCSIHLGFDRLYIGICGASTCVLMTCCM